jgi:hypothetical protein
MSARSPVVDDRPVRNPGVRNQPVISPLVSVKSITADGAKNMPLKSSLTMFGFKNWNVPEKFDVSKSNVTDA